MALGVGDAVGVDVEVAVGAIVGWAVATGAGVTEGVDVGPSDDTLIGAEGVSGSTALISADGEGVEVAHAARAKQARIASNVRRRRAITSFT